MAQAVVEALLRLVPADEIVGIYGKGSAWKPWRSPVDYVPELSDVDVHVLYADDAGEARLAAVEAGLALQEAIEEGYRRRVAAPIHTPRPQVRALNRLRKDPAYMPSPPATMHTLHGREYDPSPPDLAREREICLLRLREHGAMLEGLGPRLMDKPGRHLQVVLRDLVWRVSPTAPRVLFLLGVGYAQAWSPPRSQLAALLMEAGEVELAESYCDFYLHGWECFLSGHADSAATRAAIRAAVRVLQLGAARADRVDGAA
jgi:hypothetical protein